jgi:putative flippase GtrA
MFDIDRGTAALVFRRLVVFGVVGLGGTFVHYALMVALVEIWGASPILGTACGALAGALTNYVLNYHVTFRSTERHRDSMPKFMAVAAFSFVMNPALLWLVLQAAPGLPYLFGQFVVTGLLFLANFALNSLWTFRSSYARRP